MTPPRHADPADLGRGPLTRRLPVYWQAPDDPPATGPFEAPPGMSSDRFLLRVLLSAKRFTIPAMLLAIMWQVGESAVPVVMGAAIDQALATSDTTRLIFWIAALAGVYVALTLGARFSQQLTTYAIQGVQHRLRASLSRSNLHPTQPKADQIDGGIVSTMTTDVTRVAFLGLVVYPVAEMSAIVFIAVTLLLIYWPLGVIVLLGAPVAVWLMGRMSNQLATSTHRYQTLLADTVGKATDLVAGYRVIKGIRAEDEATARYRTASRETLGGAYRNLGFLGRFITGSGVVSSLFVVGVTMLAGYFAVEGHITVGNLIAAVGLTQALMPQMSMLVNNAIPGLASARASARRVVDHIRSTEEDDGWDTTDSPVAALSDVPTVRITLPDAPTINATPGEIVGVRADDRAASDLVAALLRPRDSFITVELDDLPTTRLDHATYRTRVTVSPHNVTLFSGSIAENLRTGTRPELAATALHAAACEDFAAEDRATGEMDTHLSGGQRQRLALARALATDAPVLVLHDPTTAVDSVTEQTIADRLRAVRTSRTALLITSSPALLSVCDQVIDLQPVKDTPA